MRKRGQSNRHPGEGAGEGRCCNGEQRGREWMQRERASISSTIPFHHASVPISRGPLERDEEVREHPH